MVEKELALLDPHLVSVLKCSAIIGRSFRASIVAEIFNINILDFLELLKGAEDRNIIRDVSVEDDIYEFVDKRMLGIFKGLIIKSEDGNEPQIIKEFHKKYITIKLNELANKKITPNELPYRDILSMAAHANAISDVTLDKAIEYNTLAAKKSYERGLYKVANDYFEISIAVLEMKNILYYLLLKLHH